MQAQTKLLLVQDKSHKETIRKRKISQSLRKAQMSISEISFNDQSQVLTLFSHMKVLTETNRCSNYRTNKNSRILT